MSVNRVFLLGRVGKDVEVRDINGTKCATFTLATSEKYKDRNGEVKELTEWHNIVAWRQTADICEKYVKKGDQLFVEGRIKSRTWETERGEKRYATDIVADKVELLGKPQATQSQPTQSQPTQPVQQTSAPQPRAYQSTSIVDDLPPDDSGLPF